MPIITLTSRNDFGEWRSIARELLRKGTLPQDVRWCELGSSSELFDEPAIPAAVADRPVGVVPRKFVELAELAICHSDPDRFDLLYRLLWRLQKDRDLLEARSDADVGRLERRVSAVRRDSHKMTAFVRFRSFTDAEGNEHFAAWFEPEHYVLERTAEFFVRRFSSMSWGIVAPYRSAFWDGTDLTFSAGGSKADVPSEDAMEESWRTYFASIFNPARLNIAAMKSEMPVKYWRNLPEAELIPSLVRGARKAEEAMIEKQASQPSSRHLRQRERRELEETGGQEQILSLADARAAVQGCRRCPLYEFATQAVFGEGPEHADLMFVGEQPGDSEDLAGQPFIGPAGKVFDAVLGEAGIDRNSVYVTNAVKHFKYEPRGKRRIHQKPNAGEVQACRFWLNLERGFVRPKLVVALGATAAQSLLGRPVTISSTRSEPIALEDGSWLIVTVHPSFLLRIRDKEDARRQREQFRADLEKAREFLAEIDTGGAVSAVRH